MRTMRVQYQTGIDHKNTDEVVPVLRVYLRVGMFTV